METLQAFADRFGLTLQAAQVDSRPDHDQWQSGTAHWLCTLSRGGTSMTFHFSMGAAHRRWDDVKMRECRKYRGCAYTVDELKSVSPIFGARGIGGAPESIALKEARQAYTSPIPPELPGVLNCLMMDAQGYENAQGFEDWAAEYGYDPDSRKAEKTYREVERQAKELRHILGLDGYRTLLENVESL